MSDKLSNNTLWSIALISLAGQIAWGVENQFFNVFMYNKITSIPIYISIMVNLTTIVGTISTIIMGSFSDVKGKRKPFMFYGFILWAITTAIFPMSAFFLFLGENFAIFMAILFDCIMTFFGAMALNAAFNAYITDVTTQNNRGKAMSIAQMTMLVSLLIVYGAGGILLSVIGDYNFFYLIGGLVGAIGLIGVYIMKESVDLEPMEITTFEHIKNTFTKKVEVDYKNFLVVLVVIAVWQIGLNVFFPFLIIYLQHQVGLTILWSSILIFIALLVSILLSYPLGIVTDKIGRRKMTLIGIFLFSASVFLIALSTDTTWLLITGSFTFIGYSALVISTFSWVKDLYPDEGRGQYSGYWNLFSGTIPMIIGPLIGGWLATQYGTFKIIDGRDAYVPNYLIFVVGAILILLTLIPLYFAKDVEKSPSERGQEILLKAN